MVDYYVLDTEAEKANSYHLYPVEPLLSPVFNFCECSGHSSLKYLLALLSCTKYQ